MPKSVALFLSALLAFSLVPTPLPARAESPKQVFSAKLDSAAYAFLSDVKSGVYDQVQLPKSYKAQLLSELSSPKLRAAHVSAAYAAAGALCKKLSAVGYPASFSKAWAQFSSVRRTFESNFHAPAADKTKSSAKKTAAFFIMKEGLSLAAVRCQSLAEEVSTLILASTTADASLRGAKEVQAEAISIAKATDAISITETILDDAGKNIGLLGMLFLSGYDVERNSYSSTDMTENYAVSCETPMVLSLGKLMLAPTACSASVVLKLP